MDYRTTKKWIVCETYADTEKYNAGSKARDDVYRILKDLGYEDLVVCPRNSANRGELSKFGKVKGHFEARNAWRESCQKVGEGDTVFMQIPLVTHHIFLKGVLESLKKKHVRIIAIVHDLESIRYRISDMGTDKKWRVKREELVVLDLADKLIIHNASMKEYMVRELGTPAEKLVELGIFDYLISDNANLPESGKRKMTENDYGETVVVAEGDGLPRRAIIAGNLDRKKCGYIYKLPEELQVNLFGANYEPLDRPNVEYFGKFLPDDLPFALKGDFGLVWDGDSVETCSSAMGEYLKLNNPHKTSLYLASGFPVIVWEQSALAPFVKEHGCGICVDSLKEAAGCLAAMDEKDYQRLKENADRTGQKIRIGGYLKKAMEQCNE